MIDPTRIGALRLGGRSAAFDRMIAAASAVATSVLHDPIGGARLPEPVGRVNPPKPCPTAAEAYAIGFHAVASARVTREQAD